MKKIFTHSFRILILIFPVIIITLASQAQMMGRVNGINNSDDDDDDDHIYSISFNTTPTLISGTALTVGAKYKFLNVFSGVRAEVTIVSATNGATVTNIDDNTLTKPEAFSPVINIPANKTGLVEFQIQFFKGNSFLPKIIDTLRATAMDIDGTSNLHEIDVLNLGGGTASYVSSTPEISVVQSGTTFTGTNIAGNEYIGVDTAAKQAMFTVTKRTVTSFIYKAGAVNASTTAKERQKGIYFKGFTYPAIVTVLPVKYLSFNATATDAKVVTLDWATSNEINNDHFEVERSFNGKDFSNIGIVLDGFENASGKSYAFRDNSSLLKDKSVAYYRLMQIDLDGKINYSNVISVRFRNTNNIAIEVSPNPFTERLTVRFNSEASGNAEIRITDLTGKTVSAKKMNASKGYNNLQIENLSSLSSGMYLATVVLDGQILGTQKIIK